MGDIEVVTYPYDMGEDIAKECGFTPTIIGSIQKGETSAVDTRNAARDMLRLKVDLILFAGGDGTARDIYEAVDSKIPVLGIPSGVKVHSSAFAVNPEKAGEMAIKYLLEDLPLQEVEVMDIDEDAFRKGRISTRLYGYVRIPYERRLTQSAKMSSSEEGEEYQKKSIAGYVVEEMKDDCFYILGPGSTVKPIADELGVDKTLLGVDVVNRRHLIAKDANESHLLKLIQRKKIKIIVTPIGGQGYIFGRGNQQISPKVIRKVGKNNIIIVSTKKKLNTLIGQPLLVDTGDKSLDKMLEGHMRVIVGYREETVKKIER
jgi:predicted polyphosphate/ATP-dependent NAD kinase